MCGLVQLQRADSFCVNPSPNFHEFFALQPFSRKSHFLPLFSHCPHDCPGQCEGSHRTAPEQCESATPGEGEPGTDRGALGRNAVALLWSSA